MKQYDGIADNLKQIRAQRNLSLDQLAEATGVSKSMLRQIETGKSSPTISTISKIANGLRLSFTTLISRPSPDVSVLDFAGGEILTEQDGRYRIHPLMPFDPEHGFEIYHQEIDPGITFEGEPHAGNVEELIFVNTGRLEILVDGAVHAAGPNQLIRFAADRPHAYRNAGKVMVSAIMMICYLG